MYIFGFSKIKMLEALIFSFFFLVKERVKKLSQQLQIQHFQVLGIGKTDELTSW